MKTSFTLSLVFLSPLGLPAGQSASLEIVKKYFASSSYPYAKEALKEKK